MSKKDPNQKIKAALENASKNNTVFIGNPNDIKKLIEEGHEIKEKFITYEEYIEKLYAEKKPLGLMLLKELPLLDKTIANAVVYSKYEDLRECVATENPTSITIDAILLLEYSMRLSLFKKMIRANSNYSWEELEKLNFDSLIARLKRQEIISKEEKKELDNFNDKYRNIYFHMNIYKMAKDRVIPELDKLNLATGEVTIERNVKIVDHESLWFTAKKLFDKDNCLDILHFCVNWTNKLLAEKEIT